MEPAIKVASEAAACARRADRGTPSDARYLFLDGLRGWAAFVVLLHHVFIDGLPATAAMADRHLWAKVFFLNGTLAVCVFFVISGFALSIRYLDGGDERGLFRLAAGRYLRLALPIFAICAITHALLVSGLIPPAAQRPPPLDAFLAFTPTIQHLLSFSLFKVFVAYSNADSYDPPLWTMSYELLGSFIVFALVAALRRSRLRVCILGALFVALAACQTIFALFVAGILMAELFRRGTRPARIDRAGAALGVAGVLLMSLSNAWFGALYIAGATCLTAGAVSCTPVRGFLQNRLSLFLGWISFPLYLVQAPVIYAFSVHALDLLGAAGLGTAPAGWIVDIVTLPVAVVVAVAFCPINDWAVVVSRRFGANFIVLCDRVFRAWREKDRRPAGLSVKSMPK